MSRRTVLMILGDGRRARSSAERAARCTTLLAAYRTLLDRGTVVTVATLGGTSLPADPRGGQWPDAIARTARLAWLSVARYGALLVCEGAGDCSDLASDARFARTVAFFAAAHRPIATIGRALEALVGVGDATGRPLLAGRRVTFSPSELEIDLLRAGAEPRCEPEGTEHVSVDAYLVTAQDALAAESAARMLTAYMPATTKRRTSRAS